MAELNVGAVGPLEIHCGAEVLAPEGGMIATRVGEYVVFPIKGGYTILRDDCAEGLAMELIRAERTTTKRRVRRSKS